MPTGTPKLTYLSVVISPEGVTEMNGTTRAVFVAKQDIQRIELTSGTGAERPLVQSIFGAVLVFVGLFSVEAIWQWLSEGGMLHQLQIALVVFMFVGAWMLWGVLRKRTYLRVTTGSDTRKIVFQGTVDAKQLADFIRAAGRQFGYSIQSHLRDVPGT
jgi:hypothetical protein